jgi:hypothetical protein
MSDDWQSLPDNWQSLSGDWQSLSGDWQSLSSYYAPQLEVAGHSVFSLLLVWKFYSGLACSFGLSGAGLLCGCC